MPDPLEPDWYSDLVLLDIVLGIILWSILFGMWRLFRRRRPDPPEDADAPPYYPTDLGRPAEVPTPSRPVSDGSGSEGSSKQSTPTGGSNSGFAATASAQSLAPPDISSAVYPALRAPEPIEHEPPRTPPTASAGPTSPTVHTRTTQGTGVPLHDPWADTDRPWSATEDRRLLRAYDRLTAEGNVSMVTLAQELGIDQLQVARRLVRIILEPRGEINDVGNAPNGGKRYSAETRQTLLNYYDRQVPLAEIARRAGRTQLGVGWQIIERRHPPVLPQYRERIERKLVALTQRMLDEQRRG